MADIFLSYKRTDRDRVAPIVALLEERGWSVWWDTRIDAGEQWDEVIEREVAAARCVVAIWSAESVNSRWVRTEASEGLERGILVPVLVDATRPPQEFKRVQSIDLTGWSGDIAERAAKTLVGAVERVLGHASATADESPIEPEPIELKPIEPEAEPGGRRWERPRRPRWGLLAALRELGRFAGLLARACALAAKALIGPLVFRARYGSGTARVMLPALVAALIVVAALVLRLTGWLGAPAPRVDALAPEVGDVLVQAQRQIDKANILEARRLLKAYEGVAPARISLALGETYDPNMLAAWDARGVTADPSKAKALYQRALKLGAAGAKRRLDGLNPNLPVPRTATGGLHITVDPVITVAQSPWEASLPIQVGPREAVPRNAFVRLDGLPRAVSLSEGHAIAPGKWAVPVFALPSLKAIVPAAVSGKARIAIGLVAIDGAILAEARTELVVLAMPGRPDPAAVTAGGRPTATGERLDSAPLLSVEQRRRAEGFVERAWQNWDEGKVSHARSFFQYAAEMGLAAGAMGAGMTHDPVHLARIQAVGTMADRGEALKWYRLARELGAAEADEPLARLAVAP
jgi:TPR repeat protein